MLNGDPGSATVKTRIEPAAHIRLYVLLALVLLTAAVGGTVPAVVAAIAAVLAANWYLTPPYYRWTIDEAENVVALVVFLGVALVVSGFVDAAARRATEAARARGRVRTLARLATTAGDPDPVRALLDHACSVLGLDAAAVLRAVDGRWRVEASAGPPVLARPEDADIVEELAPDVVLALAGPTISAEDQLVLNTVAAQLAVVIGRAQLPAQATEASTDVEDGQPLDGTQPSSGSDLPTDRARPRVDVR